MDNLFLKPEKPFLLVYENEQEMIFNAWLETEEEMFDVIKEFQGYGCKIIDAIEIGSYREIKTK